MSTLANPSSFTAHDARTIADEINAARINSLLVNCLTIIRNEALRGNYSAKLEFDSQVDGKKIEDLLTSKPYCYTITERGSGYTVFAF